MQIIKGLIAAVFIAFSTSIHAIELSIDQSQRYSRLIHQYRCVVCQNQSLAESDNVVSDSLRLKIKNLIVENKTDEQIDRYLKDRYGDHFLWWHTLYLPSMSY